MANYVDDFRKTWTHDIFAGNKKSIPYVGVLYNPTTEMYFATDVYSKDFLPEVIEDILEDSQGKVVFFEALPEKEFYKKYTVAKYVGNGVSIVFQK